MIKGQLNIIDFGIACSLGNSKDDIWRNLLSNGPMTNCEHNDINYISSLALEPVAPAIEEAISKFGKTRVAVLCGTCYKGSNVAVNALRVYRETGKFPHDCTLETLQTDYPAQFIAKKFGLEGMVLSHSTACASSISAIISARKLLEAGLCDAAIVGGTDVISDSIMLGFTALEAVSPGICNPFSANRSGIKLGEGAAFFLITNEDEFSSEYKITGLGESADAVHMTAPSESGEGAKIAMTLALADAGLKPEDIDYLNLHGTGTMLNDAMESKAVSSIFSEALPVSSTKPLTGHTLGAAGAVELAFCCLALSQRNTEKFLPPHLWDGVFDPSLPRLNFVLKGGKCSKLKRCMSNSFAFGGYNACVIVEGS
ncbi:MAG: beta-ketoacyl-ACP synthase [Fibromonadales bacterium]|nr:beta-ketoacyl-ACP synthase [Fibromonadales bacterium]